MKSTQRIVTIILLMAVLLGFTPNTSYGTDLLIIGISETNDKTAQAAVIDVLNEVVDTFPAGLEVEIYNATNLRQLAQFTIPDSSNARSRRRKITPSVTPVINHLRESQSVRSGHGCELNIPAFFEVVGASIQSSGGSTRVLLIGSPFHTLNANEAMNFSPGFYPNDKHIVSKDSIFGTNGREGSLDGVMVDFIITGEIGDGLERKPVRRFLAQWLHAQGATLTSFLPTSKTVIKRVKNNVQDGRGLDELDLSDPQIRILRVSVSDPTPLNTESGPVRLPEQHAEPTPMPELAAEIQPMVFEKAIEDAPTPRTGYINIYAVWASVDGRADVDLWVKPSPSAMELYFNNKSTPQGQYLRDIRQSVANQTANDWKASWEGVEILEGNLDTTTCWLNLYTNTDTHVEGIVRVQFATKTVDVPFVFDGVGNSAGEHDRRDESAFWIPIDLTKAIE